MEKKESGAVRLDGLEMEYQEKIRAIPERVEVKRELLLDGEQFRYGSLSSLIKYLQGLEREHPGAWLEVDSDYSAAYFSLCWGEEESDEEAQERIGQERERLRDWLRREREERRRQAIRKQIERLESQL